MCVMYIWCGVCVCVCMCVWCVYSVCLFVLNFIEKSKTKLIWKFYQIILIEKFK